MKGTAGKRNDVFTIQLLSQAKEDYIYIYKKHFLNLYSDIGYYTLHNR